MKSAERAITDRFALESRVGSGAFGEVFRAVDRETGAIVAVKRMHAQTVDPIAAQRFHQEARLLERVRNEHVVGYVAHGEDEAGRLCLVLEWLDGMDLARRQRIAPLGVSEVFEVVTQAAEGLAALHAHGIVHRDVKPSNFFLVDRDDGALHVKLIDLGIARSLHDEAITLEGFRVGTPAYMSPEQARGEANITALTDVYSLGVVLFELLARRRPFTGRDPFAVLAQIVLQQPPRLTDLVPSLPPIVSDIVARAMARDASTRYGDVRALGAAIRAIHSGAELGETDREAVEAATMAIPAGSSSGAVATAEQRVVTALFAGFGAVATPGDAFEQFQQVIVAHGGVPHRTIGRRAVAVFGGERSTGDEAIRAARAASEAQRLLVGSRLALATCRVLTNAAGLSAEAIERGATQLEKAQEVIRVDATTARMLESTCVIETVDGEPALRGERTGIDEAGPQLFGRPTPMVGRDRELAILDACFAECADESVARGVVLAGPAGIGKSRIRYEWVKRLRGREQGLVILTGRGDPMTARSPFGLIARALRSHARIVDGEPLETRREKLSSVLLRAVRPSDRERVGVFLGELIGVPFADDDAFRAARTDPVLRGDAMRAAFEDWIAGECEDGAVLLLFEDVQWADGPSMKTVDAALRNLADRPRFILAGGPPEQPHAFRASLANASQEISVGPLSKKSSQRFVHEVLTERATDAVVDRIVERAEGNPFNLEELMRAVVAGQGDALPDSVLGMVQARLDALGPEAKRVIRVASVFGQTFWRGGVVSLGGVDRTQATEDWLQELVTREIVARRSSSAVRAEVEYFFRNSLLREAAYATLTDEDRTHAHAMAGAWLEKAGSVDAAALADHYERGAQPFQAGRWYLVAADAALAGNEFASAVRAAARAVECGIPASEIGRAKIIEAEAHRWSGNLGACLTSASEALNAVGAGTRAWYRALGEAMIAASRTARRDVMSDCLERWQSVAPSSDALSDAVATGARAVAVLAVVEYSEAAELMQSVRARAEGAVLEPVARARLAQGEAQLALVSGDLAAARSYIDESIREFRLAGDERNANFQRVNIANASVELGRYADAERESREVMATSARLGLKSLDAFAKHNLGRTLGLRGDNEAGLAVLREALDYFAAQHDPRMYAFCRIYASEMLLRLDRREEALRDARTAFDTAHEAATMVLIPAAAQLASALLSIDREHDALTVTRAAMERLDAGGASEEGEAQLRLAHAEALARTDHDEEARAAIRGARDAIDRRAAKIGDPSAREQFLTRIEVHARTHKLAQRWLREPS